MTRTKQINSLASALFIALTLAVLVFAPAFAGSVEPPRAESGFIAQPPPPPPPPEPPPPPPGSTIVNNIINTITQTIQFPFVTLVEALQNAIQTILRQAMEPIQIMFEAVLSLWLQNPGILSDGNAALPGWGLIKDAWQFMYSIAVAFWPLTLAVVAVIAAKDSIAASTWGLGDLKQALGTWFVAVLISATSLWWMDLANNLANAITSHILFNFAGPQFYPGTFMVFFTVVLPGLFLAFPLAGIIIIIFLLILAVTIFVALTFAIIARLVMMYLLVALGPLMIILGVLPPLQFVTFMWTRGFLIVLALGPVDALLLKMAFNMAQYASSAPPVQAAAAFIGVFGLLSILISINFAVVKAVFGSVIGVAQQTMSAVKAVGQMVVAGALLMSGAGAGVAAGGGAMGGGAAASGGGTGGGAGSGGAELGSASAGASAGAGKSSSMPLTAPSAKSGNGNGQSGWKPSGRGMQSAGNYLASTHGPLSGFGSLLRAAGINAMENERSAEGLGSHSSAADEGAEERAGGGTSNPLERGHALEEGQAQRNGQLESGRGNPNGALGAGTAVGTSGSATENSTPRSGTNLTSTTSNTNAGALTSGGSASAGIGAPPRRANVGAIEASRSAMGSSGSAGTGSGIGRGLSAGEIAGGSASAEGRTGATGERSGAQALGAGHDTGLGASQIAGGSASAEGRSESLAENYGAQSLGAGHTDAGSLQTDGSVGTGSELSADQIAGGSASAGERAESFAEHSGGQSLGAGHTDAENFQSLGAGHAGAESLQAGSGDHAMAGWESGYSDAAQNNSPFAQNAMPLLAPEADRTLSTLPEGSDDARFQAAQLVSRYAPEEQGQVAMSLEHAMRSANENHDVSWMNMGNAMEGGLWSTQAAADNGHSLQDMARQMEPFSGTRDPGDYLAWQIASGNDQFHMPLQQVPHLSAAGPYDYLAGRHIEQQTGGAMPYQDAAQMFYVIRDPATAGGGWTKGQQFLGEVNRVGRLQGGNSTMELDRWMQTNAPTRARMLWNVHFKVADG